MSKRISDQSTSAKAKITKWFSTKARKESQESIKNEEKPEQRVVNENSAETEIHTPSASSSVQATIVEAENQSAYIKFLTEPNQPQNFKFPPRTFGNQNSKGPSSHHGLISSSGCIMMLILTQHFALLVLKHFNTT